MKTAILSVGIEILFGQIVNTNTVYLSQQMNMLGFENMLLQILLTSLLSLTWKICIFRIHHFK